MHENGANLTTTELPAIKLDSLSKLQKALASINADGPSTYNWPSGGVANDMDQLIVQKHKAGFQLKNLIRTVGRIGKTVHEFSVDDFTLGSTPEEREDWAPVDPIGVLKDMMHTEEFDELPSDIGQYKELVEILPLAIATLKPDIMSLEMQTNPANFEYRDENGKLQPLPVDYFTPDRVEAIRSELEQKEQKRLADIDEILHCLDNYNEWYRQLSEMIDAHRPYSEILQLFK